MTEACPGTVLVAPDALKGSLDNVTATRAISQGLRDARWNSTLVECPLADGGDGTLTALAHAGRGRMETASVSGPYGESTAAEFWMGDDGVAVVELARAAGLAMTVRRDPLNATTFGVGELVRAAYAAGAHQVWVGCGGSATVDGGVGLLSALGYRFLDNDGRPLRPGGGELVRLDRIEPPVHGFSGCVHLLADVDNPLVGATGAAVTFGPQKGADAAAVSTLEAGLRRMAEVIETTFGRQVFELPGAGAAGGVVGGLVGALGCSVASGFDAIAERLELDSAMAGADLVLTAEGQIDEQTQRGKTVGGLIARAGKSNVPVWAFAGRITEDAERWCPQHVHLASIMDGPRSLDDACRSAATLLRRAVTRAARLWR